jgi:hypothetical protein
MLHNFPPLPPNYDRTILIEMPGCNVDIAALSRLTVLLQLVVWQLDGGSAVVAAWRRRRQQRVGGSAEVAARQR